MNEQKRTREEILQLFAERRTASANSSRDRCVDSEWGTLCSYRRSPKALTQEEIDAEVKEMEAWRQR